VYGLLANVLDFVTHAVSGGYVLALAAICLIQYVAHIYGLSANRRDRNHFRQQIDGLESQLSTMQRERQLSRYENQMLREFVSQSDSQRAISLVLRRLVPNADEGFACFLRTESGEIQADQARGLSRESQPERMIDVKLLDRIRSDKVLQLDLTAIRKLPIWEALSGFDRAKIRQLFLMAVENGDDCLGLFVSTDLFPTGIERVQQIELASRVMLSVGCSLKQRQSFEEQQTRLTLTSEMLMMRSVADHKYEQPTQLAEAVLRHLIGRVAAARGALLLVTPEQVRTMRTVCHVGDPLGAGVRDEAARHMEALAKCGASSNEPQHLDARELARLGIRTLFGRALVVPLVQPHAVVGALCLVRTTSTPFTSAAESLALWTSDFVRDALCRAAEVSSVKKQATTDGLTDLSNRRSFDERLAEEIRDSGRTGAPCSLILFDLDKFKSVNDTYGHQAGDDVLKATAALVKEKISRTRAGDRPLCGRYGGEELVVLLPGVNSEGAMRIAESIRQGIELLPIETEGQVLRVTTSGGVGTFPLHARSAEELVAAADTALYRAKHSGRNRILLAETVEVAPVETDEIVAR
jgi:diguanylate cyclase (GGDEF)-like protein